MDPRNDIRVSVARIPTDHAADEFRIRTPVTPDGSPTPLRRPNDAAAVAGAHEGLRRAPVRDAHYNLLRSSICQSL
ncbi:hypothetical protein MGAST_11395 [Mycobacterium gastri 'Wayne']|uniref:Uncharacterized protein n=1 Tax=Mycobacterium gastri TaxID=1777 RepID=A0A1X1VU28_MYCGS|nr:hypothetical protein MGAST_11395 [Mycobacterium gastri 'Wayne']ORV72547.1 hypothetical protein AWC07_00180 [Mycobacterium gastri]